MHEFLCVLQTPGNLGLEEAAFDPSVAVVYFSILLIKHECFFDNRNLFGQALSATEIVSVVHKGHAHNIIIGC